MSASASASYAEEDFEEHNEASEDEIEEDSQIGEEISEAASDGEGYSSEFAEATVDADDHKRATSRSNEDQLSPHVGIGSPPKSPILPPSRPLVGIGSPPKPSRRLADPSSKDAGGSSARGESSKEIQTDEESYPEDFAEGTMDFEKPSKKAGSQSYSDDFAEGSYAAGSKEAMRESPGEGSHSYSEDFGEASAAAGKSESGTLEMSEALESSRKESSLDARHRVAEELEAVRLKQEADTRARVEERRRQQAEAKRIEVENEKEKVSEEDSDEVDEDIGHSLSNEWSDEEQGDEQQKEEELKRKAAEESRRLEEDKKRKAEVEERKRQETERLEAEERKRVEEEERRRTEAEEERKRKVLEEEETRKRIEAIEERNKKEAAEKQELLDNERKRLEAEEERRRIEAEEEKMRVEEEDKKRVEADEEKKRAEAEAAEEKKRIEAEEEKKRIHAEEEQKRAEAEEEKRRAEAEEEKNRAEAEEEKKRIDAEEEKKRAEAEEEKKRIETEEEKKRAEAEEEKKRNEAEEEKRRAEAEEEKKCIEEEEEKKRAEAEEEKKRIEADEQEKRRAEAEEERKRIEAEEEHRRIEAEEEKKRVAAEEENRRIEAEEEKKRTEAEEERRRIAAEEMKHVGAEKERQRLEVGETASSSASIEEATRRHEEEHVFLKAEEERTAQGAYEKRKKIQREEEEGRRVEAEERKLPEGEARKRETRETEKEEIPGAKEMPGTREQATAEERLRSPEQTVKRHGAKEKPPKLPSSSSKGATMAYSPNSKTVEMRKGSRLDEEVGEQSSRACNRMSNLQIDIEEENTRGADINSASADSHEESWGVTEERTFGQPENQKHYSDIRANTSERRQEAHYKKEWEDVRGSKWEPSHADAWWSSKGSWWSWPASSWRWSETRSEASRWQAEPKAAWSYHRQGRIEAAVDTHGERQKAWLGEACEEGAAWSTLVTPSHASNHGFDPSPERPWEAHCGYTARCPQIAESNEFMTFRRNYISPLWARELPPASKPSTRPPVHPHIDERTMKDERWLQDLRLNLHFEHAPLPTPCSNDRDHRLFPDDSRSGVANDAQWLDDLRLEGSQFRDATSAYIRDSRSERLQGQHHTRPNVHHEQQAVQAMYNAEAVAGMHHQQMLQQTPVSNQQMQQQAPGMQQQMLQQTPVSNQQMQQQALGMNQLMLQQTLVSNQQMPQQALGMNQQMLQQTPVSNQQMPQQALGMNQQMLQQTPVSNQQMPQQALGMNQQMPQQTPSVNQQIPHQKPVVSWAERDIEPGAAEGQEASILLRAVPSLGDLNPADFGGLVAIAIGEVVDNLLELKYNQGIDIVAFAKQVEEACDGYASLSMERMLNELNSKKELVFLDKRKEFKLRLRLGYRRLQSFEDLKRVVRLIPGTASATAVITFAGQCANPGLDVVAAFRIAYSDSSLVVGRTSRGGGQPLLRHFGQPDFCGAVAIDPVIEYMSPMNVTGETIANPPHAPEYVGLEPLLQYINDGQRNVPPAPSRQMPAVPPALLAVIHATVPTDETMKKVKEVLERPDVEPDGVLELFRKLADWLKNEPHSVCTRQSLAAAHGHKAMIVTMHRHGTNRELLAWICRVIGWSTRNHVENAVLFVECGAAKEICYFLEQHRVDKDLHRHALYAIGCLAHYGAGVLQAIAAGAITIILRSLKTHRDSPSVQINGCEVLRCLAESGEAALDDLGLAAQEAKRAFPRERSVHRAADALLLLVVPRTVCSVAMLMDSKQADPAVQNSAARSFGQLASYGGVAWKASAPGAVSRIIRAMDNHRTDVGLQAVCLWALGRLAERVEAPTAGMYDAAQRARKNHPESALVLRHAEQLNAYLLRP